jgi:glutamate N-acetyltransferase/amino-acid N-acetyltransferase
MAFATGKAGNQQLNCEGCPGADAFAAALEDVCRQLAHLVVRDGEGAHKFIAISVSGAVSDDSARRVGLAIANSPLVKTAIAGEDANWGRVVMAVGKAGEPADRDKLSIGFGGVWAARRRASRWPTTTRRRSPHTSRGRTSPSRSTWGLARAARRCGPAT